MAKGAEIPQPDPKLFGVAIDVLTEYCENIDKSHCIDVINGVYL